jgi:PAS domain S-box-containing protein
MDLMVAERLSLRAKTVTTGAVAAVVIGLLGLAAWIPSWLGLGFSTPELMTMAPLTGLGLAVLGGSLLLESRWPWARRTTTLALLVSVVAFGRLLAFWAGLPDWPDEWFIPTRLSHRGVALGHISPLTSLAFLLGAVALAGLSARSLRRTPSDVSGVLACLLIALSLVVLLGYAFGTPLLYGGSLVPMAFPTAIAFACLGAALIALSGPQRLPLRPVIGTSVESRLLRGILPMLSAVVLAQCLLFRFGAGLNPALRAAVASLAVATVVIAGGLRLARRVGRVVDEAEFERGQAARKLGESEERLRDSEELFRSAFACATEGVCLVGTEGRFLRVNPALCEMLGYTAEELEERSFDDVTYEEDRGLGATVAVQSVSGNAGRMRFEKRYVHKDGRVIWAQVATARVQQQGSPAPYFTSSRTCRTSASA